MIEVNKNRTKTDEAWERLYARLDEDNLLAGAGQGGAVRRKLLLKWGTLAAAVIAGSIWHLRCGLFREERSKASIW